MKAPFCIAVLSLSILGLTACASSQEGSAYVEPARVTSPDEVRIERDAEYVAYVERTARRRGILVQWVNPPNRRITAQR